MLRKLKNSCSLLGSNIGICVAESQRKLENQGLVTEVKNIWILINDLENDIAYWEKSKQSKALT